MPLLPSASRSHRNSNSESAMGPMSAGEKPISPLLVKSRIGRITFRSRMVRAQMAASTSLEDRSVQRHTSSLLSELTAAMRSKLELAVHVERERDIYP